VTIRIRLTVGPRGPMVFEDFCSSKRWPISIVSVSPSGSSMPKDPAPTAICLHQPGHAQVHQCPAVLQCRQTHSYFSPLLDGGGVRRAPRTRNATPRVCAQVLYEEGKLGHGGQQYASLLHSRPVESLGTSSHTQNRSRDKSQVTTMMWDSGHSRLNRFTRYCPLL